MESLCLARKKIIHTHTGDETYKKMIESGDASVVVDTLAKNLAGVAMNKSNFAKLPDTYWGYYARGHDGKGGKFAVIVTYSEKDGDVDDLVEMYEQWIAKNKAGKIGAEAR